MSIDWKEQPEGCTHYTRAMSAGSPWLRKDEKGLAFWNSIEWKLYPENDTTAKEHFAEAVPKPDYKGHDNLADMLMGHIRPLTEALRAAKHNASLILDHDSASYWDHELKALREIKEACEAELAKP